VEGHAVRIPQSPGWVFGDVALLFNSPRTASVVASSGVVLYAMDRTTFLTLVMRHAQVGGWGVGGGVGVGECRGVPSGVVGWRLCVLLVGAGAGGWWCVEVGARDGCAGAEVA
jgi:hypothetical protein